MNLQASVVEVFQMILTFSRSVAQSRFKRQRSVVVLEIGLGLETGLETTF